MACATAADHAMTDADAPATALPQGPEAPIRGADGPLLRPLSPIAALLS